MWKGLWRVLWVGLGWWEKRQLKIAWIMSMGFLIWIAYDVGVVVTSSHNTSLDGNITGQWTLQDFNHYLDSGNGGNLRLDTDDMARFQTIDGKIYVLPHFGDKINQDTINKIKKNHVIVDGQIRIETVASKKSDTFIYILLDIASKAMILVFYGVLAFLAIKYVKDGALVGGQKKFKHILKHSQDVILFKDVAGQEGPKREIREVVEYLKNPKPFKKVGAKPIRGILLYGPPGNGKTMLAKAVAGEAHADFIEQSASNFMEMYVGVGARSVRDLFAEARKNAPCVIFIDEIDAMGTSRGKGQLTEYSQTLNALLTEMDGFGNNDGIVVMAATNRIDDLDEALVRPGRFDRKVKIPLPGRLDRLAILEQHSKSLPAIKASLDKWADQTPGFSGAQLAALVNEAAYEAANSNEDIITDKSFSLARDKILLGVKDKGYRPSLKDLKTIAVHELGHATIRLHYGQKIEKISIEPRGLALGVTIVQFEEGYDILLQSQQEIHQDLVVLMGGRAAEEVFFKFVTGGSADDMEKASSMAREVVRRYGFSAQGQHVCYVPEHTDLLKEIEQKADLWVQKAYQEAFDLIKEKKDAIETAIKPLIEEKFIDGETLEKLLGFNKK